MDNISIGLFTILMSGVSSAVITHHLNSGREERELLRRKGEELYCHMHTFESQLHAGYAPFIEVIRGNRTAEQVDIQFTNLAESCQIKEPVIQKIHMIVGIYFPGITSELKKISDCHNQLRSYEISIRTKSKDMPSDTNLIKTLNDMHLLLNHFNEELIKETNRLTRSWWKRQL